MIVIDTVENIILWSGISLMFVLFGVASVIRGYVKLLEIRKKK